MKLKYKDFTFVIFQVLLFGGYIFSIEVVSLKPSMTFKVLGTLFLIAGGLVTLLSLVQLNKNLTPFPTPKANSELIQYGLYKFIRHPIYTGIITLGFGIGFYSNSVYKMLLTLVLWTLFYFKSVYEEKQLQKKFLQYDDYKLKTGRFFPKL